MVYQTESTINDGSLVSTWYRTPITLHYSPITNINSRYSALTGTSDHDDSRHTESTVIITSGGPSAWHVLCPEYSSRHASPPRSMSPSQCQFFVLLGRRSGKGDTTPLLGQFKLDAYRSPFLTLNLMSTVTINVTRSSFSVIHAPWSQYLLRQNGGFIHYASKNSKSALKYKIIMNRVTKEV